MTSQNLQISCIFVFRAEKNYHFRADYDSKSIQNDMFVVAVARPARKEIKLI